MGSCGGGSVGSGGTGGAAGGATGACGGPGAGPAAGGITTVIDMPLNSSPVTTNTKAFREKKEADPTLMYGAVRDGGVDVIVAYTSDGRIEKYGLVLLEDDLGVLPSYDAILLVSAKAAAKLFEVQVGAGDAFHRVGKNLDGHACVLLSRFSRDICVVD